ncbi:MAG: PIN domain-containing protein, partial [Promethearchaeota archaeon]
MKKVCLDAGILAIFFSKDISSEANDLLKSILQLETHAYILKPILIESYYHLCKVKGAYHAESTIKSFLFKYPIKIEPISEDLIYSAGKIKCQNRKILSYNDSLAISYCLNNNITFYTTEKNLKDKSNTTLSKLRIKTF